MGIKALFKVRHVMVFTQAFTFGWPRWSKDKRHMGIRERLKMDLEA